MVMCTALIMRRDILSVYTRQTQSLQYSQNKQNSNTDVCVLNWTSKTSGVNLSGLLKSVNLGFHFKPIDEVCDSLSNIFVIDLFNCQVHLLSADVEFMKYLLTENELTDPYCMSLYISTPWVGNTHSFVKVFQYYNKNKNHIKHDPVRML